ncbi:nucleosome assembly protein [Xylaria venustula]|nr:nucleosome assembly protein [Xylaria venustula]
MTESNWRRTNFCTQMYPCLLLEVMADVDEENNVTYEALADLEQDFEDVEVEIIRQQYALSKPLYEKREKLVAKIPNFWPLVIEQAPRDIDQYIQPSDSAVLASSLTSVSVSRFEIENGGQGDPRSICIRMEFSENEYFEDKVLEKKFWFRHHPQGEWLVSEPVPIKWKTGKDLTQGLLDLVVKVWEQDKKKYQILGTRGKDTSEHPTADEKTLMDKIDTFGLGGVSFFCWFGYHGQYVTAEENAARVERNKKRRADKAEGKIPEPEEGVNDADFFDTLETGEIFPEGDELAIAFSDDLWPNAIKYFKIAQEAADDDISDIDFEEDGDEDEDDSDEAPPLKKVKT